MRWWWTPPCTRPTRLVGFFIVLAHWNNSPRIDMSSGSHLTRIHIFASQGLRSALLIFTLGIVRRIFVIPVHCHLLDFDSYAPCNDVIFSQSTQGFHFLSFECPENWLEIIIGSLLVQTFCTNSVAANRTNFFILSKSCRTDDFSHFYFVDIFPTEHELFVKPILIGCSYH